MKWIRGYILPYIHTKDFKIALEMEIKKIKMFSNKLTPLNLRLKKKVRKIPNNYIFKGTKIEKIPIFYFPPSSLFFKYLNNLVPKNNRNENNNVKFSLENTLLRFMWVVQKSDSERISCQTPILTHAIPWSLLRFVW